MLFEALVTNISHEVWRNLCIHHRCTLESPNLTHSRSLQYKEGLSIPQDHFNSKIRTIHTTSPSSAKPNANYIRESSFCRRYPYFEEQY